jgi:hypothetical protein
MVFIDETTTVPPATQAALLRVTKDGVVGEYDLNPGIIRVAAANPPEMAAGGWHLAPPLANRFIHFDWKVTAQEWADANINNFETPFDIPRLPDDWKNLVPPKRALVSAFIQARPQLFQVLPTNENESGKAWASGRTWDYAGQLLAAGESVGADLDAQTLMIAGAVGPSTASEFMTWFRELDLPDPEELLKNPGKFKNPDRPDKVFAVLSSVVSAVINNRSSKRWDAAWEILAKSATDGKADIAAFAAKTLSRHVGPEFGIPREHMKPFVKLLQASNEFG